MTLKRLVALAGALLLFTASLEARADPKSEAGAHYKRGIELYRDGDYQAALVEFRRAYDASPNFATLYNIGQVEFTLQDYVNAASTLQKYLTDGGKQVPAQRRAEVERDLEKLKWRVGSVEIAINVEGAELVVDDVAIGKSPFAKPVLVNTGRHKLTFSKSGYATIAKTVEVAGGETAKLTIELVEEKPSTTIVPVPVPVAVESPSPTPTPASSNEAPAPPAKRKTPWIWWGATGGLAVGGIATGVIALASSSSLKSMRTSPGQTRDGLDAQKTRTQAFALVSDICFGAAIAAGSVSLYLTLSNGESKPDAKTSARRVDLAIAPTSVRVLGAF